MNKVNTQPQRQNALVALDAYAYHLDGGPLEQGTEEDYITDLLTDLRHLCEGMSIDFYDAIGRSYHHYLAEKDPTRR